MKIKGLNKCLMSRLTLLALLMSFSTACVKEVYNSPCPPYPKAGPKVANEIGSACFIEVEVNGEDDIVNICPEYFEWLGRIDKLARQLDSTEAND